MTTEPFRVFSGWDRRQVEAAEVFKFSVEQNASIDVDVRFLQLDKLPIDRQGVTAFTYSRFLVPFLCGYEDRALFADGCDQLCFGDVAELAAWDMQGKPLWVVKHPPLARRLHDRPRSWTSFMLMDCSKLTGWGLDYVKRMSDDQLMRLRILGDEEIGELPAEWNMLRDEGSNVHGRTDQPTKIMHWSYLSDPNGGSWIDRSGSEIWQWWRERWRQERANPNAGGARIGRPPKNGAAARV